LRVVKAQITGPWYLITVVLFGKKHYIYLLRVKLSEGERERERERREEFFKCKKKGG
jgi:hypothetical protein